jgi:hypothetical protein
VPAVLRRIALLAQGHDQGTTGIRVNDNTGAFAENMNPNFSSDTLRRFAEDLSEDLTERQQMALLTTRPAAATDVVRYAPAEAGGDVSMTDVRHCAARAAHTAVPLSIAAY